MYFTLYEATLCGTTLVVAESFLPLVPCAVCKSFYLLAHPY